MLAALTIALAAVVPAVAAGPVPSAVAAPADDCAAPTRTVSGGGWTPVTVSPGEVVLVTGRFTAGVERLPSGGTLCVAAGAVLAPAYLNSAAGVLHVDPGGTAQLPWVSVSPGFVLDNAGTTSFQGLNVNGPVTLGNAAGASLTVTSSFVPSAGTIVNEGTLDLPGGLILNPAATLTSSGRLTVGGSATIDGTFVNTGRARVAQSLLLNGSASLTNGCVLEVGGALDHSGGPASSTGLVVVGGTFTTNGTWRQSSTAALSAATLLDDGAVTGFGRYVFSGSTSVQGRFTGDSATAPIAVDVPGAGFDVATGTVANVQFTDLALPAPADYPAPDCAGATPVASADVRVGITGPAVAQPGSTISYRVTATNDGPSPAAGVRVVQTLPAAPDGELTDVTADQGGVVAGGTATWDLGALAPGASRTVTVTGTVPASGFLSTTVRVTTTTPDPDPSDDVAGTSTEIDVPVVQPPPTAGDVSYEGEGGVPVLGALTGAPGAPGIQVRFAVTTPAQAGAVALTPDGLFAYLTPEDFAGTDSFTYEVCDNQVPERCAAGTATVVLHPRAVPDETTTAQGEPVAVTVTDNDFGGTRLAALATPPAGGTVTVDPATGVATYTPDAGFVGDDTFVYRACAVADPTDCVTAPVLVHVLAVNRAPQAFLASLVTTVDAPVAGPVEVTDPDGDPTTVTTVFAPVLGASAPDPTGTRYVPPAGFAGTDLYAYVACDDGDPALCSTGLVGVRVDPVAGDDAVTTTVGTPVDADVLANDLGTVLPPEILTAPTHGTATSAGRALTYTPAAGFAGTDAFTYRVCAVDGSDACAEATVVVTVAAGPPTGTPGPGAPVVVDPGPAGPGPVDPNAPQTTDSRPLATTGADAVPTAVLGVLLLVTGATVTVVVSRRRTRGRVPVPPAAGS